ncbi:MAG: DUF1999 family protein [Trueperaceae bacterium]|nr:MAG: DUF1999 family protein [Trueperaceae bacterium]
MIDQRYAASYAVEPIVNRASLSYYARSGHAFIAEKGGIACAFVLGHAIWNGSRATVWVDRLAARENEDGIVLEVLLEAVTKSAYDAGVYRLRVDIPESDGGVLGALQAKEFGQISVVAFERRLGSGRLSE